MADKDPQISQESQDSQESETQNPSTIGSSYLEIQGHGREISAILRQEIQQNQLLNQEMREQLLKRIESNLEHALRDITIQIQQTTIPLTEIQEFEYICLEMTSRYHGLDQVIITSALGHYIARKEPQRYLKLNSYLSTQEIDTSHMHMSAIRAARSDSQMHDTAFQLISAYQNIPHEYRPEIQDHAIDIIKHSPLAINADISHIFHGDEHLLLENLQTEELYSGPLTKFLNLSLIQNLIDKQVESLEKENDPHLIIEKITIIHKHNPDFAEYIMQKISNQKSVLLEPYIAKQFNLNQSHHPAKILFFIAKNCINYPTFIFDKLHETLNDELNTNLELMNYFIHDMFISLNFLTCEFFINNLSKINQNPDIYKIFIDNIYIDNFNSLSLFSNLTSTQKVLSLHILLKSYQKHEKEIFLHQINMILASYNQTSPYSQQERDEVIEILNNFPEISELFLEQTKNIIKKAFYIIPPNIETLQKSSAEKYTVIINQINIENLAIPSQNTIQSLPTNYFQKSVETIGNFKHKFNLSTQKMQEIVEYLKKIQHKKNPDTNFDGYQDEIQKIYT